MKNNLNVAKEIIVDKLDLPRDIILDVPKIIVTGDSEITIENHKGVVVFSENQVKVSSGIGLISIYGSNFEIIFMGGTTIVIGGKFKSVIYESGK